MWTDFAPTFTAIQRTISVMMQPSARQDHRTLRSFLCGGTLWSILCFVVISVAHGRAEVSAEASIELGQVITLRFEGPETSESDDDNPFLNHRLDVTFRRVEDDPDADRDTRIRGFYAADGNAAHSGASSGNIWMCRFRPDEVGRYRYEALLRSGPAVSIDSDVPSQTFPLENASGEFVVGEPSGNVVARVDQDGHYFVRGQQLWLKFGANSPENLLAFADFDGTHRIGADIRDGESDPGAGLHRYEPHLQDFRAGDPTWGEQGRGRALIGLVNYVADQGLNSIYFLTLNIGGDGNDVWPYASPDDFKRFDCSKLAQWEIVFSHATDRGVALHCITQETENETLLDGGKVGPDRRLYYQELAARFAHHPGWVWNIGEETGPTHWKAEKGLASTETAEHRAIAKHLKSIDPYGNLVLIHSHAGRDGQTEVLEPLLGEPSIDGISLQTSQPARVHADVLHWRRRSAGAGRPWIVSMDEIGPASRGVAADAQDPNHDELRGPMLWGSLLGGAAGIESYFGYKTPANDLDAEDLRSRANWWALLRVAHETLRPLDLREFSPIGDQDQPIGLAKLPQTAILYRTADAPQPFSLGGFTAKSSYKLRFVDPSTGSIFATQTSVAGPTEELMVFGFGEDRSDHVVVIEKRPESE